jgi:thiol-disulfide isomerase/thioredoxin
MRPQSICTKVSLVGLTTIALSLSASAASEPSNLDGRWDATLTQKGLVIPFRLDISGDGEHATGTLYNGEDKETTTSAKIQDGTVRLNFEHYLTSIAADVKNGELDGQVIVTRRSPINITPGAAPSEESKATDSLTPFHAKRYTPSADVATGTAPSIDGVWEIPYESSKGEKAWRLIVKQTGAEITTTLLRVDGDTGALTGGWKGDKFVASHFDGSRPGLITISPQKDGTLQVDLHAPPRYGLLTAYRPEVARAKGLPEPANYLTHTSVRDPNEVFAYSFRDVNGKIVSNDDPKFKGKVVLAIVTGTWCPNCHDEAQYLVQLYSRYHSKGVEIVALDFEEADQQESLTRVHAFISQYKVPYTYLIAGTPDEMWDKVPQAVNLNTWPATFFIGKDGKVKATYSGFAARASGVFNQELKEEFKSTIDRLLADNAGTQSTASIAAPVAEVASR